MRAIRLRSSRGNKEDNRRTAMITAYVARVLALTCKDGAQRNAEVGSSVKEQSPFKGALKRALDYLARRVAEINEPYMMASYALAAQTSPSALYDYYNPEAKVKLAPTKFIVHEPGRFSPLEIACA